MVITNIYKQIVSHPVSCSVYVVELAGQDLKQVIAGQLTKIASTCEHSKQVQFVCKVLLQSQTQAFAAMRLLKQDHMTLVGGAERLDSTILTQADALVDARDLLKTFLPVMEAIASKDHESFNTLKTPIGQNIANIRDRVAALKTSYKTTSARREEAQDAIGGVLGFPDITMCIFDHDGPQYAASRQNPTPRLASFRHLCSIGSCPSLTALYRIC